MMNKAQIHKIVSEIKHHRIEFDAVEVKSSHHAGGTPKLYDSLSSMANLPGGGIILLGLDERKDFAVVGVGNPQKAQEDIANWARKEMEPPVGVDFIVDEIDGKTVMAVEVKEVPNDLKPCYYKPKGLRGNGGAYIRAGGTDRAMSDYEIFSYISSRSQPMDDETVVSRATMDDLDSGLINYYIENLRKSRPRAGYLKAPIEELLSRFHICRSDESIVHPTLAGLLAFGKYPQEFFPQLTITFVQYYGITEDEHTPRGERFVDNQRFEGPVAEMVDEAVTYVLGAMRKSSLIEGTFRRDIPEYPQEALREAIANAVAHRDYSSFVRGSQIRISMFANRLEIKSPGGLFGNVTEDNIEEEHSTRNARLMRMMEDLHIVENRGSGIRAMLQSMRDANLEPPRFADRRASFLLTFHNHSMLNPESVEWLNQFADRPLNDNQRLALVYLRQHKKITNSEYRRLNRVDPLTAGNELKGLVASDLAEQLGVGRSTNYRLAFSPEPPQLFLADSKEGQVMAHVRKHGAITNRECRKLLELDADKTYYLIKKLCDNKNLKPEGKGRWRKYVSY